MVQPTPKVKSPSVGRGHGSASKRGTGRGRGQKRPRIQHLEDNASDEEKYIPRSSKRRAAVAAVSRMKQPSDYEDDDFDDVLPARPIPVVPKSPTKTGRPRGRPPGSGAGRGRKPAATVHISDDESDPGQNNVDDYFEDSSEVPPAKKKRGAVDSDKSQPTSRYGKDYSGFVWNFATQSCFYSVCFFHFAVANCDDRYQFIRLSFTVVLCLNVVHPRPRS